MPSPIGLFSRRKNSEDKALRAALAPHVDPYIYNTSPAGVTALQSAAISQSLRATPLVAYKEKTLPKPPPIAPGYTAESAGLVFAPHLSRARTSTFDNSLSARENGYIRSRKPLVRSSSSGLERRTKSFDQRSPMASNQEFVDVLSLDSRSCPSSSQQSPVNHNISVSLDFNRSGAPRNPAPLSATGMTQKLAGLYSPVSVCPVYPVSPPLSPESSLASPGSVNGSNRVGDVSDHRAENDPEAQHGNYVSAQSNYSLGILKDENESSLLGNLEDNLIGRSEFSKDGQSRELAALRSETQNLETADGPSLESLEGARQLRRREYELVGAVKGKEKELEFLRSGNHVYREQIAALEQVLAQKDEELQSANIRIYELSLYPARNRNTPMIMMEGISEVGLADKERELMEEIQRRERAEKQLAETIVKAKSEMDTVMIEEERKRGEIRAVVWAEFENTLHREEMMRDEAERKLKENLQTVLEEEEGRRAELNWVFGEKIEKIECLRRKDLDEFQNNLARLKEEKEGLEKQIKDNAQEIEQSRKSVRTQRSANEELLVMAKKINTRLGEEKRKNRHLEEKINQITEDALNSVSSANRQVLMLKNVIEDKDTAIKFFETELAAIKKDKKAIEEAWVTIEAELEEARKTILDRDEMAKGLREENKGLADRLEACRKELGDLEQNIASEKQKETPEFEDVIKATELLKQDIELYKKDVKVYKKDVKKRDNHIKDLKRSVTELESLLESKKSEAKALQNTLEALESSRKESPPPLTESPYSEPNSPLRDEIEALRRKIQTYEKEYRAIYDDYEALKKKHDLFVSQQAMIITEIDKQLTRAQKEKDIAEAAATRQLKKMQHGFLQLSQTVVAGRLAGVGGAAAAKKYHEAPLPPLPIGLEGLSSSLKRSNTGLRRAGSKLKAGKRRSLGEKGRADLSPVAGTEAVKVVDKRDLREGPKSGKTMGVVNEPNGSLGEEEVIEW